MVCFSLLNSLLNSHSLQLPLATGAHNDARMNVTVALTAASEGAAIANHVEVTGLIKEFDAATKTSKIIGAHLRDTLSGESWDVRAKAVVNATGPFSGLFHRSFLFCSCSRH